MPVLDDKQDFILLGREIENGILKKVKFVRKLDTNDSLYDQVLKSNTPYTWAIAYSNAGSFIEHS